MSQHFSDLFGQMTRQAMEQLQKTLQDPQHNPLAAWQRPGQGVDLQTLLGLQTEAFQRQTALCAGLAQALQNQSPLPELAPDQDARFRDAAWHQDPLYSFVRQSYLIQAGLLEQQLQAMQFDEPSDAERWRFYIRQLTNALAPTNFAWTNPAVMRDAVQQHGESLQRGLINLLTDLQKSPLESLAMSQVDGSAFGLGTNIAVTPGQVVYRNALMELIQYQPSTPQVYTTPLLIVPPFINKYYVLDLGPEKSLVRWLVAQGFTVFMVSWVNPDARHRALGFEDYLHDGVFTALEVVSEICDTDQVHAAGYCVGGTLLACTQAWLRAQGRTPLASLTLLTTLLDFSEPGDLGHYLYGPLLDSLTPLVESRGLLDGRVLAASFSALRENDLYWPTYINNYLRGQTPPAFDLLYWNSDTTNLTEAIFHSYVRTFYGSNPLMAPGGHPLRGIKVSPALIDTPAYVVGAAKDHIVLWPAAWNSARALAGPTRFVQAGSGHIAGVVNPPAQHKYGYRAAALGHDSALQADDWLAAAEAHEGSWWPDWVQWLAARAPARCAAREPGNGLFPPLMEAPGRYVRQRLGA